MIINPLRESEVRSVRDKDFGTEVQEKGGLDGDEVGCVGRVREQRCIR